VYTSAQASGDEGRETMDFIMNIIKYFIRVLRDWSIFLVVGFTTLLAILVGAGVFYLLGFSEKTSEFGGYALSVLAPT
jgi:hypothetical protein